MSKEKKQIGLFKKFTYGCVNVMQKYLPDPFILCNLNILVFLGSLTFTKQSPLDIIKAWSGGFWSLLAFSMQMALVLVAGHAMASSPIIKRFPVKHSI